MEDYWDKAEKVLEFYENLTSDKAKSTEIKLDQSIWTSPKLYNFFGLISRTSNDCDNCCYAAQMSYNFTSGYGNYIVNLASWSIEWCYKPKKVAWYESSTPVTTKWQADLSVFEIGIRDPNN